MYSDRYRKMYYDKETWRRRIEKDYEAERKAAEKKENTAEPVKTETVQGDKNESEQDTEGSQGFPESSTSSAAAEGAQQDGQPDHEQERPSEESGDQSES